MIAEKGGNRLRRSYGFYSMKRGVARGRALDIVHGEVIGDASMQGKRETGCCRSESIAEGREDVTVSRHKGEI